MKFKKTIAVADDEFLFRKGFIALLSDYKHIDVIIESENGKDLLEKLKVRQPDLVFLDIEMPLMNGIETTEAIRKFYPKLKIIILTSYVTKELMFSLVEKGANAFLSKNSDIKIIVKAINEVIEKGYYFDYEISQAMVEGILGLNRLKPSLDKPKLSSRELEVIKLICNEHSSREIADILCLSPRTIDTHREKIFQKTGAKSAIGVAFYALKNKLYDFVY